jgi:CorA-like Mg2+ transporter protein
VSAEGSPTWLRRVSVWCPDERPGPCGFDEVGAARGFPWFELVCDAGETPQVLDLLGPHCPGLTVPMLEDLLTPDDSPKGAAYEEGAIRLASTFSATARRDEKSAERGKPLGAGVLEFQPVELLAGPDWLISCWHPTRTFQGAEKIVDGPPGSAAELFRGVQERWEHGRHGGAGDLGVAVMNELALSYAPAHRELLMWLEDWELSLYLDDELDSQDELPELWGLAAMLRKWLNPLNRPGLRSDVGKAWLPATDHEAVIEVDERVDKALAALAKLSETLRQSFGLLHVEQAEEKRQHDERTARRLEAVAAGFLVPTLIVGFYGANTWIPGQNKHWGFWVMVALLVLLSCVAVFAVTRMQRRTREAEAKAGVERAKLRRELLRGS